MMGGASKFLRLLSSPIHLFYTRCSTLRFARHSWISLACLSSAQNRSFCSNNWSRLGFSIKSSENIHNQTSSVTREGFHGDSPGFSSNSRVSYSWPEWSKLVENLKEGGYFDRQNYSVHSDDAFSVFDFLPEEFVQAANACLLFARDRPNLLGWLPKRDIEVIVENGSPFLFKGAVVSSSRMKSFLRSHGSSELEFERACTVDLMHFLLSYAFNPVTASDGSNVNNRVLVESSVRNLLSELADTSRNVRGLDLSGSTPRQFSDSYGQTSRPPGKNIEMKRGDWICPKCSFMNFARNVKCLECDEPRTKGHLTGGEWECPQCNFFNFGRNSVCLKCDCKRPGEASIGSSDPRSAMGYTASNPNKAEIESKLDANEEKAERWFSKISQLDNASDLGSAIADEDFPEIMPLRKGVSRFVVSTRKTPLERRLANAQYRRNLGNGGVPEGNGFQETGNGVAPSKASDTSISQTLDRILGCSAAVPELNNNVTVARESTGIERSPLSSSAYQQHRQTEKQPETGTSAESSKDRISSASAATEIAGGLEKSELVAGVPYLEAAGNTVQWQDNPQPSGESWHTGFSGTSLNERKVDSVYGEPTGNSTQRLDDLQASNRESWNSGYRHDSRSYAVNSENNRESWKSWEGSAVKELDPLDMSEEAKAERWFRRVAQIKDISELSKIPDEDFPQIMPMRKGVNRFVVSKRKTPLERRLTSPQYRRNLPIVSSEPVNKENDSS